MERIRVFSEVTFRDFALMAKSRGHTVESLVDRFRGQIEEPRDFFERVIACRYHGEDRSDVIIPYGSVLGFYAAESSYSVNDKTRLCACGCGRPAAPRSPYASKLCQRRNSLKTAPGSTMAQGEGVSSTMSA